jgi:hypothetical protein
VLEEAEAYDRDDREVPKQNYLQPGGSWKVGDFRLVKQDLSERCHL